MKIQLTEKFLWDLYNLIERIEDAPFSQPITMRRAIYPDFYRLKRIYEKKQRRKNFSKLISYFKKRGLIKIKELEEKKALIITPKGKEKILKIRNKFIVSLPKKRRKDGKWVMVAFDISEKKKRTRDYFRERLIDLSFQKLQKSIWICPYDILKEVKEIARNLRIETNVRIFLVEETEF
ncbi:CRISPR-associated endonuclease Cas2 [bacterium]|nr:CRISPR-associated endonuclease Cas2 [bacterium]